MALLARSTGLNQKVGTGRRRNRKAKEQEKAFNRAKEDEMQRQKQLRKDEMLRDVFQTTEGGGIMEGASISLGFDDEDEDDLFQSSTGLIV